MFSFIGMISGYLGYINMNVRLKNQVYTVLGSVGNFYLLYVAYRFFANGFWGRGSLFILAFIALGYLVYLNIIYYFTKKNSHLDFTPWLEKKFHLEPRPEPKTINRLQPGDVQTNGLFTNEKTLPAELVMTAQQQEKLKQIINQLAAQNCLQLNYGGLSDEQILQATQPGQLIPILKDPVALPYFELIQNKQKMLLVGGINQIEKQPLATIKTIGLMPVTEATKKYRFFVATAAIVGGPVKFAGRSSVMQEDQPFVLKAQLAYRPK